MKDLIIVIRRVVFILFVFFAIPSIILGYTNTGGVLLLIGLFMFDRFNRKLGGVKLIILTLILICFLPFSFKSDSEAVEGKAEELATKQEVHRAKVKDRWTLGKRKSVITGIPSKNLLPGVIKNDNDEMRFTLTAFVSKEICRKANGGRSTIKVKGRELQAYGNCFNEIMYIISLDNLSDSKFMINLFKKSNEVKINNVVYSAKGFTKAYNKLKQS